MTSSRCLSTNNGSAVVTTLKNFTFITDVGVFGRIVALVHEGWMYSVDGIAAWRRRSRARKELKTLRDRDLRDLGWSRCDTEFEIGKPVWQA
jgi:uncharacterized protein YjiS (DUF1127 family)